MILDAILMLAVTVAMQLIKNKRPNFLFFPKGAVLFLPPEEQTQPVEPKNKKNKNKTQAEINVVKIEYQNVKQYPFANELSRVLMTTASLVIFVILRMIIGFVYKHQSLLSFYTLGIILVYTLKLGIDTFFLTNYNKKQCFLFALGLNIFFYVIVLLFDKVEGVFDQNIKIIIEDYVKHLEIIFNRELDFITHRALLGFVFFLNFFIVIAATPAIIKFGNWYSKTLKQMYYEDEEGQRMNIARRADREQSDIKQQQSRLKEESKQTVFKLNFYLGFMLALIVFSHRYMLNFGSELFIDLLRAASMGVCVVIICSTMNTAIEFNGSFAYKFVIQYFEQEDQEKRKELRKRIAPYIYYIWYHYFQFIVRIIIPLLVFLLIITWKYLYFQPEIVNAPLQARTINPDIECAVNFDQLGILENLYRCPANLTDTNIIESRFFLSGVIESIPRDLPHTKIQQNMQNYSVMTTSIMVQLFQQLFWYSSVSIYLLTVGYILFLRKTVYQL